MATSACKNIDFSPDFLPMEGLRVGFVYAALIEFKDRVTGDLVDISLDTFEMEIKDSTGATVETLGMGTGLSIYDDNNLLVTIGTDTTQTAGEYTYLLVWNITDTGASVPAVEGKIYVEQ